MFPGGQAAAEGEEMLGSCWEAKLEGEQDDDCWEAEVHPNSKHQGKLEGLVCSQALTN